MFKGREEDATEKKMNTLVGNVLTAQTLFFIFFLGISYF